MSDIVICAHNEEGTIYDIVRSAVTAAVGKVIVVADKCDDRTASLAHQAGAFTLLTPYGDKGSAVMEGLKHVGSPRTILFDADLTGVEPEHFEKLDTYEDGMTVGIRGAANERGKSKNISAAWSIGGERCLPTESLMRVSLKNAGYKMEMRINHQAKLEHIKSRYVWLDKVDHVTDFEKMHSVKALQHDVKRWIQVIQGYIEGPKLGA